jgi:diguanylate cyclase (GGDEF)-like protein
VTKTGADEAIARSLDALRALRDGRFDFELPPGAENGHAELDEAILELASALESRAERSAMLADITRKINEGLVLEDILDQVYENFAELIPYDRIGFALLEEGRSVVRAHWARSEAKKIKLPLGYTARLEDTSLESVMQSGHPRILNDLVAYLEAHPRSESTQRIVDEGMRSSLTCPLLIMGQPVGFLFFSSTSTNAYERAHQQIFQQIAGQLAVTLEKSRLYEGLLELTEELRQARDDLEHAATRDSLTGLWNRQSITDLLRRELARAARDEMPLAAVMVDVDHFKQINDRIGHLAGDAVLTELTTRISCTLRSADVVGRLGGEEFLIILYPANEETSVEVMERVRRACAARPVSIDAGDIEVTVSLGAAVVRDHEEVDLTTVLKTADHALYRAKNDGRNRSVFEVV